MNTALKIIAAIIALAALHIAIDYKMTSDHNRFGRVLCEAATEQGCIEMTSKVSIWSRIAE